MNGVSVHHKQNKKTCRIINIFKFSPYAKLGYIFKILQRSPYEEQQLAFDYFHELLKEADIDEKGINKRQIEFLFEMLDTSKDGMLSLHQDMPSFKNDFKK